MIFFDVTVRLSGFSLRIMNGIRIFEIMERPGKPLMVYSIMIRLDSTVDLR